MIFKIGRYYKHTTGKMIHALGFLPTTLYGLSLIAECTGKGEIFMAIGSDVTSGENWVESNEEEWMSNFST